MAPPLASSSAPADDSVDGSVYINALASYIRQHESKLADFVRRGAPPTAPSWTTLLTLGVISSEVPIERKPPLILRFDPHHLYYLLLKFDEMGVEGIGSLDVLIDGGPSRPMSVNYGGTNLSYWQGGAGGMLGVDSDTLSLRSTFSGVSTFSLGSGWWGASAPPPDVSLNVKYLYSSCTKLPALRLVPFSFSSTIFSKSSHVPTLSKPVKDFEDCPPPNTAVPLYAFKNLQSLILEDLDPRAFLGWDVLSAQLRSLELKRSGIEDLGELICDAVVEDFERRKKGRGGVGKERRLRQGLSHASDEDAAALADSTSSVPPPSAYRVPPPTAWRQLRHLSLSSNSLTFLPSPPLAHLQSLTSLDLSSNLLIAVPPGLASLHSLRSLNLSDNMIDSLQGVSKALGNVAVINFSKNRIDNLSGLDRLFALERLDLRENRLDESLEISRLAPLPFLKELWIEGNPFAKSVPEGGEDNYRVKCFNYFVKEGREGVKLDGTGPGIAERRGLVQLDERDRLLGLGRGAHANGARSEEARSAAEAKIVGRRSVPTPSGSSKLLSSPSPPSSPPSRSSLATSPTTSPVHPKTPKPHHRRKPRRIVDLDGAAAPSSSLGEHSGTEATDSDIGSSPALEPVRSSAIPSSSVPRVVEEESPQRRHARFPSEGSAATTGRTTGNAGRGLGLEGSASVGRGASRRERVTASSFEPPPTTTREEVENSGEAFRKRIEALRNEVGESWLSVLGEREMVAERTKSQSQSEESGTDGFRKGVEEGDKGEEGEGVQVKVVKGRKKKGKKNGAAVG